MRFKPEEFSHQAIAKLVNRRHPKYLGLLDHWKFLAACYAGGREWFTDNIFHYMKEGKKEYSDRLKRAYRFNHTREVVDLVNKYLYRSKPKRNYVDAPEQLVRFWKDTTINGLGIDEFSKTIAKQSSIYGRVWVVVDSTVTEAMLTEEDVERENGQIYSYVVTPEDVLDMSYDDRGVLNWILIRETVREDDHPIYSTGNTVARYRLWTRNQWFVFKARSERVQDVNEQINVGIASVSQPVLRDTTEALDLIASGEHNMGIVPVVPADNVVTDDLYTSQSLIADVAYLDRACANYASNLDAIIQDQTFSQLAMPAQGLMPGDDEYEKMLELGTKRIFLFDGEGGAQPFFLSPDPRQATLISEAINQIINEIYQSIGLGVERTRDMSFNNADKASGVAKSLDFERVSALLTSKADSMQQVENRVARIACLWAGVDVEDFDFVSYPRSFDVRELYDEFYIATQMSLVEMPVAVRGEQMKTIVKKLFPQMSEDLKRRMLGEIGEWVEQGEEIAEQEHLSRMMDQVMATSVIETGTPSTNASPSQEPDTAANAAAGSRQDPESVSGSGALPADQSAAQGQTVIIIKEEKEGTPPLHSDEREERRSDRPLDDEDAVEGKDGKFKGMGHWGADGIDGTRNVVPPLNPYEEADGDYDPKNPPVGVPPDRNPDKNAAQVVFERQRRTVMTRDANKVGVNVPGSNPTPAREVANSYVQSEESRIKEEAKRNREISGRTQSIAKTRKRDRDENK